MKKIILSLIAISLLLIWQCNPPAKQPVPTSTPSKKCSCKFNTKKIGDRTLVSWKLDPYNQKGYTIVYYIENEKKTMVVDKNISQVVLPEHHLRVKDVVNNGCLVISTIIIDIDRAPFGTDIGNIGDGYRLPGVYSSPTMIENAVSDYINDPQNTCFASSASYQYRYMDLSNIPIPADNIIDYSTVATSSNQDDIQRDYSATDNTRRATLNEVFWEGVTNSSTTECFQYFVIIRPKCQ